MGILTIIPARGGSKGIPGKNKRILAGKPLVTHTIDQVKASGLSTEIIVSTDSEEIREIVNNYDGKCYAPFTRPAELAADDTPTFPVVIHALEYMKERDYECDIVLLLQPTNPFRSSQLIREAVKIFKKSDSVCLISVKEVPHEFNPHWVFTSDENGSLKISTGESKLIPRRQELPTAYYRDGSVYLFRSSHLMKGKWLEGKINFIVNKDLQHVNLDTEEDWLKAERILDQDQENFKGVN